MLGHCEGTGRSCANIPADCEGNILVTCVEGYRSQIDCAKEPGQKRCDAASATCKGAGTQCVTGQVFDACEGGNLAVCIDGFKRTFDCVKLGFLGCKPAETYGAFCDAEPVYE